MTKIQIIKEKIKNNRIYQLLYKFCSVKGMFVICATAGMLMGKVSEYIFGLAWIAFIGSRELWKHFGNKPEEPMCGKN